MPRVFCSLSVALVAASCVLLGACGGEEERTEPAPYVPLEISHETTRIVSPLTDEGRVDYIAALNAGDVPDADENAAIPILRIVGTDALIGKTEDVLASLGAPDGVPAAGSFVPVPWEVPYDLDFRRLEGPDEEAVVAEWITANRPALDALVEATERPRLWLPVDRGPSGGMLEFALPVSLLSDLGKALAARAESRRLEGNVREGWDDIEALLRLHGLLDQLPGTLSRAVASGARRWAWDWLRRAFESSQLTEDLCSKVHRVLARIPPRRSMVRDVDVFTRYIILDCFLHVMTQELAWESDEVESGAANVVLNQALREINRAFDEAVPFVREPNRERLAQLTRLNDERRERLEALSKELQVPEDQLSELQQLVSKGGVNVGRSIGEVIAGMGLVIVPIVIERVYVDETKRHVATLATALRLHELRNGSFPDALDELVAAALVPLPVHPLDGTAISYERTDRGCRVGDEDGMIEMTR